MRVPVGDAEVIAAEESSASLHVAGVERSLPGLKVEIEIPEERLRDEAEKRLREIEMETPAPKSRPGSMAIVPAGTYPIGVDLDDAKYYNQLPRHTVELETFWIDRRPVTQTDFLGFRPTHSFSEHVAERSASSLVFEDARAFCQWRYSRLPTEFEWEAAINTPGAIEAPILEWTDSWYQPYPGNSYPEEEYGKRFRVVRGRTEAAILGTTLRRFLDPLEPALEVGFRCVDPGDRELVAGEIEESGRE